MLKQSTVWLLILAVFTANCSRLLVYAGFNLNQNYIASKLCENRGKPWMHCNGKCYLIKKIRQAEENERNKTAKDNLPRIQTIFFEEPARYHGTWNSGVVIESKFPKIANDRYHDFFYSRIFQPPRVS
jgi:hypothetical protein